MTDSDQYQKRYWKELFELRVHVNYLELYMEESEFIDNSINIFLAVTSSSSICGWVIWNKYGFVWAVIIAASQVINVVKQFLPYKTRLKTTCGILKELEELLNFYETKWFDVAEGKLKNDEINKLQFEIRTEKTKIVQKNLGKNTLPEKGRLFRKAKQSAEIYINNFYGEKKMSDPKKTPQTPKQQPPRPEPSKPETVKEKRGLPPVDQTPDIPPVKPPKDDQ